MSSVDNWILLTNVPDAPEEDMVSEFVSAINVRVSSADGSSLMQMFRRVDAMAGGNKRLECEVYLLATNYFDYDEMVKIISEETAGLDFPGVQLVYMGQDDAGWRFVELAKGTPT